jgi:RimJ/RimL family protein N-acetyltransferase
MTVDLLIGQDAAVLDYLKTRLPDFEPRSEFTAIGSAKGDRLIGGILYHNFSRGAKGNGIEMVCAGVPGWLTRNTLYWYFWYPFVQLECIRVMAVISKKNRRSRSLVERLGYKIEGVHPYGMADGSTAMSYGMLKQNCRWIHGQKRRSLGS